MKQLPRSTGVLVVSLLLALSAGAGAREIRMHGPNGESGACPDVTMDDDASPAPAPRAHKRASPREKAKATPMLRAGDAGSARPRWHSILPGMFR